MSFRSESVHDSSVHAIKIAPREGVIRIHTGPGMSRPDAPLLDVIFEGVIAHHLQGTSSENILFDIEETTIGDVLKSDPVEFDNRFRHGVLATIPWDSDEVAADSLAARGIRAFVITASLGMSGWVLCTQCRRVLDPVAPTRDGSTT